MELKNATRLGLVLALIGLTGCSALKPRPRVTLHPIEKSDIFSVVVGSEVKLPDGTIIEVVKDGWFLSDFYLDEVTQVKVER